MGVLVGGADATAKRVEAPVARRCLTRWQRSPSADAVLCGLWVPFAIAAALVASDPDRLAWVVAATLSFSFAHQPLTLWLVYGDADQFAARRWLFALSPPAMVLAVVVGVLVSPALVAAVAATWNAAHTLRQRYGVVRIYGRLAGQSDGHLEAAMLWSWLALAVALVVSDPSLGDQIAHTGIAGRNRAALDGLAAAGRFAPLLVAAAGVAAVSITARWARQEAARPVLNPAKWAYLASTAALFAVIVVQPVAGFVGYIGAHAAEYVLLVHRRLGPAAGAHRSRGALYTVVGRISPTGFLVGYGVGVVGLVAVLDRLSDATLASTVLLTLGGLHLLHDSFIWKLRRPELASRLGIPNSSTPAPVPTP